jgi:hypothetical protein
MTVGTTADGAHIGTYVLEFLDTQNARWLADRDWRDLLGE